MPKIEVMFDIDANGILNVTAKDMSTSRESRITITNDKGRLSKDEIDRMVHDAEKYKDDDDQTRDRIESKNRLENLCFSFKQAAADANALSQADKDTVSKKCEEVRDETRRAAFALLYTLYCIHVSCAVPAVLALLYCRLIHTVHYILYCTIL